MKIIYLTIVSVIFMSIFLPALLSLAIRNISYEFQSSLDKTQKIYGSITISQSFIAKDDNLSQIGMSIKNPNLAYKKDLFFTLLDDEGKKLRDLTISGKNIPDGEFIKFKFTPVEISKNQRFTYILSAPQARLDDALEVFLTNQRASDIDLAYVDDQEINSISFVSFYKSTNSISLIFKIYSEWLNRLVSDRYFFVIYLLLIFSMVVYLTAKSLLSYWNK